MTISAYLETQEKAIAALTEESRPYRAYVTAITDGKVAFRPIEAATGGDQLYARIAGFDLAVGQVVMVIGRTNPIVLGRVQTSASDAPSFLGDTLATSFVTRTASGVMTNEFALDSLNSGVLTTDGNGNLSDSNPLLRGHVDTTGSTPAITALAAAGTTAAITEAAGNDTCGFFRVTPGGTGIAAGAVVRITFAVARADTNYTVLLAAHSNAARSLAGVIGPTSRNTTHVELDTRTALTSGQAYQFGFLIVGY